MAERFNKSQNSHLWNEVLKKGPLGLSHFDWDALYPKLDQPGRAILKRFLSNLEEEAKWIVERTEAMREEAERVELLGRTMQRAGLRSYTDEKGRIFIAADVQGKEQ